MIISKRLFVPVPRGCVNGSARNSSLSDSSHVAVASPRSLSSAINSAFVRGLASSACIWPTSAGKLTPSKLVRFSLWTDEKESESAMCVSICRTVFTPGAGVKSSFDSGMSSATLIVFSRTVRYARARSLPP